MFRVLSFFSQNKIPKLEIRALASPRVQYHKMASLASETKADAATTNDHACLHCGALPTGTTATNCIHRGKWHSKLFDCTPRCAWKLGRANLGAQHYSCCFSTEQHSPCIENTTHAFAGAPVPTTGGGGGATPHFGVRDCPRYVVDLDAPPSERWNEVVKDYAEQLPGVVAMTEDILGSGCGASLATGIFATAAKTGWVYYGDELKGIAKASGVPLGKVVLLQIAYEAFAACTSIVANGPDGCPIHIRSMDWDMAELQPLVSCFLFFLVLLSSCRPQSALFIVHFVVSRPCFHLSFFMTLLFC